MSRIDTLEVTADDIARFALASHDVNPLHLSERYAQKTAFGDPVVFGMLAALEALPEGVRLEHVAIEFRSPLQAGVAYQITRQPRPDGSLVRIHDGARMVMKVVARHASRERRVLPPRSPVGKREQADDLQLPDLSVDTTIRGHYFPQTSSLRELPGASARDEVDAAVMMLASYLVGMRIPGRRALFASADITFRDGRVSPDADLEYVARVTDVDARFDRVTTALTVSSEGAPLASASLVAYVRTDAPTPGIDAVRVPTPRLEGKSAIIIGASRGLGAWLALALAAEGCRVRGVYARSDEEAAAVAAQHSRISMARADGGSPEALARVQPNEPVDFLVLNACPSLQPLSIDVASAARISEYVQRSVALALAPLAALLPQMPRGGQCVAISSIAVRAPVASWPHYVAAKCALEGLVHTAAIQHPTLGFVVARPPRLDTEFANGPLGRAGAMPARDAALAVVGSLVERVATGAVGYELLEIASPPREVTS